MTRMRRRCNGRTGLPVEVYFRHIAPLTSRKSTPLGDRSICYAHGVFGTFWFASLLSNMGTWAQQVAEPWLLLSLGASSFVIGLDAFVIAAPVWILTLVGGVLADRAGKTGCQARDFDRCPLHRYTRLHALRHRPSAAWLARARRCDQHALARGTTETVEAVGRAQAIALNRLRKINARRWVSAPECLRARSRRDGRV
jgi:hypothetical protein